MYRTVRWLHGQLALFLLVGTLAYAISGWLFDLQVGTRNVTHQEQAEVPALADVRGPDARKVAEALQNELGIPGRLRWARDDGDEKVARFVSLSRRTELRWSDGSAHVRIERTRFGPRSLLLNVHTLKGTHGGPAYVAWALLLDLLALAMLGFAASGIYLWWGVRARHPLGWLALCAGCALTIGWVGWLSWGP